MLKISIIIATYNSEKTLKQALDSIRYQTYQKIETIIVDGGSTDSTLNIIHQYNDVVSKYITEKDNGVYDAFNKGIKMATGDFICFLGSDDCYCDYKVIEDVATYLDNNRSIKVLSCPVYIVDELTHSEFLQNNKIGIDSILNGSMIPHQGIFTSIDIIQSFLFDVKYKLIADYDFILKCILNHINITFVDRPVAYYSNAGLSSSNKLKFFQEHINLLEEDYITNDIIEKQIEYFFNHNDQNLRMHFKEILRYLLKKTKIYDIIRKKVKKDSIHKCSLRCCRWCKGHHE